MRWPSVAAAVALTNFTLTLAVYDDEQFPPLSASSSSHLRYVQAIWRHGDRAPKRKPYPDDIYDEKYWPRGWNQLTTLGMKQMQELGEFLHDRYIKTGFVSEKFDRNEVFVRSSSADRAIESAQSLLSGLFLPSSADEKFDSRLNWQPIPIHTNGAGLGEADPLLRPTSFECPIYKLLRKASRTNFEIAVSHYNDLAEFLRPILHIPPDKQVQLHDIAQLKNIELEMLHNLSQPEWVHRRWPQYGNRSTIEIAIRLRAQERAAEFNQTAEMAHLSGGWLLGDWLQRVKKVAERTNDLPSLKRRKMLLYSAHDGTLLALMAALRLAEERDDPLRALPFAASLLMELREAKNQSGKFFVELFLRRNRQLEKISLVNCTTSCPLDQFLELTEPTAIFEQDELYRACGAQMCVVPAADSRAFSHNRLWLSLIIAFSSVAILLFF